MKNKLSIGTARLLPLVVLGVALGSGCQQARVYQTIHGKTVVYPDSFYGAPTVVAFLNADDRRCDDEIQPLTALYHRPGTPVKVICVMTYEKYDHVEDIEGLNSVVFDVVLDPGRRIADRNGVDTFPKFALLNTLAKPIAWADDWDKVAEWVDSPSWHEKSYGLPVGSLHQSSYQQNPQDLRR